MELNVSRKLTLSPIDIDAMTAFIKRIQKMNGEIPWSLDGKTDPWDHVESAMGLSMAGCRTEAERAYLWLVENQQEDGSWCAAYRDGRAEDRTRDTNMSTYIAVGTFHHYLMTEDLNFLREIWPALKAGIDFAVQMQANSGEIYWAKNEAGVVDPMALLTGCSSIYMSLKCGLAVARLLGKKKPAWERALAKLGHAIRQRPNLFNMIKSRFSMDWYYPVLCGAITGAAAIKRMEKQWEKFVVPEWGVRCVSDRPWVTMAETSELVLALEAIGDYTQAELVFSWLQDKKFDDGSYWMGVTFPDRVIWPEEKTTWTAAAVLIAYDALMDLTPAAGLFRHDFWERSGYLPADLLRDLPAAFPSPLPAGMYKVDARVSLSETR
ncbi:MAG TPA: hypothetical protein PKX61_00335 [Syntrophales bacterium]|jgi:hypothetical protein|nr:hypothetical protein [Syntrophales bacterium]HQN24845.1 hypothetical protein [Syntrophales bacterium]